MALYIGNSEKLVINLSGKKYKIADPVSAYVRLMQNGTITIDQVPEQFKAAVEKALNSQV